MRDALERAAWAVVIVSIFAAAIIGSIEDDVIRYVRTRKEPPF
jgi:hypothetical protein